MLEYVKSTSSYFHLLEPTGIYFNPPISRKSPCIACGRMCCRAASRASTTVLVASLAHVNQKACVLPAECRARIASLEGENKAKKEELGRALQVGPGSSCVCSRAFYGFKNSAAFGCVGGAAHPHGAAAAAAASFAAKQPLCSS